MEVGLKFWSRNPVEYIDEAKFADFLEVLPVDEKSLEKFEGRDYRYAIHVPHENFGFSPAVDLKTSKKLLYMSIKAADRLKAEWIIMHSGAAGDDVEKAMKAIIALVKEANDNRILIENSGIITYDDKREEDPKIAHDIDELKRLLESGMGFCLDMEHAAVVAKQYGFDYEEYLDKLAKLKPDYVQVSGTKLDLGKRHLSIFDSVIKPEFVKSFAKGINKPLCLETPLDMDQRKKEVEFLKE
jgi:deoxyribonuclease IV